ncbi:uncharacterized protein LOC111620993 [Centruroides sculpturatus]|uniref:uncharacterized protein LOC111620993 n=1 Tax=Centruroides sculpturatus TaxID=218467 RepID=UPI000C6CD2B1|nr:uncharacterized protein LOC111620993 [Centruroides sculpturatus]
MCITLQADDLTVAIYPFDVVTAPNKPLYDSDENYASELRLRLATAYRLAQEHAEKAAGDRKRYHQRKNKPYQFTVGDRVFVKEAVIAPGLKRKLTPRWSGPFRIIAATGPVNFEVQHVHTGKKLHVHANRLKPAVVRSETSEAAPRDANPRADDQDESPTGSRPQSAEPVDPWDEVILTSITQDQMEGATPEESDPQASVARALHGYALRSHGPVPEQPWVLPTTSRARRGGAAGDVETVTDTGINVSAEGVVNASEMAEQSQINAQLPPVPLGLFTRCE